MGLPTVLSYPEFLAKAEPFVGTDISFLYTRNSDCKTWSFAALYLCLEDTIEDRRIYDTACVAVDFRKRPLAGGGLEVEELNENLE